MGFINGKYWVVFRTIKGLKWTVACDNKGEPELVEMACVERWIIMHGQSNVYAVTPHFVDFDHEKKEFGLILVEELHENSKPLREFPDA